MPTISLTPPCVPLLNDQANEFLAGIVTPQSVVFEFGSGASTIWFAEHAGVVFSVESDETWYWCVKDTLNQEGLQANIVLVPTPDKFGSQDYADQILTFSDETFDIVLVDGKARPHCILNGRAKVKRGGWMVLDDTTYDPVRRALHLMDEGWERVAQFRGRVWGAIDGNPRTNTTGFWRKEG
jgi:predicted O-methyltransferase YrrM